MNTTEKTAGKKAGIQTITQVAVMTAVIAVVSQLSIPMPAGVPMTLQTFIIPLAALVLGTKKGTLATLLYVLIGIVGVPVFSGLSGGPGVAFGITGGFIISFPLMALAAGLAGEKAEKLRPSGKSAAAAVIIAGLVIGAVINYLAGMGWFSKFTGSSMKEAFVLCVLPFLPTTVVKIAAAAWIGPALRKTLRRAGVLDGTA